MRSPRRRANKDNIKGGTDVAMAVGNELSKKIEPTKDSFTDGVEAEHKRIMDPAYGVMFDLGPHTPPPEQMHGASVLVSFPPFWRKWMAKQTAERLAELDEVIDERLEREAVQRYFRRIRQAAIAALVMGFVGAKWFSDQIGWISEKLPVLKAFWHLVTGAVK